MISGLSLLVTDQYRKEAQKWLGALKRKESVSVSFIPKTDRIIRLEQLLGDKQTLRAHLGPPSAYHFQIVDFSSTTVESASDLEQKISGLLHSSGLSEKPLQFQAWMAWFQKQKRTLILIIPEGEKLLNPIGKNALSSLSYLVDSYYPHVLVLSFFESHLTHSSYSSLLPPSTRLYANVFQYPLYETSDVLAFIALLEKEWGLKIDQKMKDGIVDTCGGHFWLVKEAVRQITATGTWDPEDEAMLFRLRSIYHQLLPSEQNVLKKLVAGKSDFSLEERLSLDYLQRMRVVHARQVTIGMFTHYILKYEEKPAGFTIVNNVVFLNTVPVDKFFSRKERRVLKVLIEHEGVVVSRNDIASVLWPADTEAQYSDWAIDQIISRVRKRLSELYISPETLAVVRGKGYLLNIPK